MRCSLTAALRVRPAAPLRRQLVRLSTDRATTSGLPDAAAVIANKKLQEVMDQVRSSGAFSSAMQKQQHEVATSFTKIDIEMRRASTKLRHAPTKAAIFRILHELRQLGRQQRSATGKSGVPCPNVYHYSSAFYRLSQIKQWREAIELFNEMRKNRDVMSVLQNVGETNSKSHSSDNAIETGSAKTVSPSVTIVDEDLFERLPLRPQASSTSRVPVNDETTDARRRIRKLYNEALILCGRTGQWRTAFEVLDDMRDRSCSLINTQDGGVDACRELMAPDDGNYTAALTACGKSRDVKGWEAAVALFELLKQQKKRSEGLGAKRAAAVHPFAYNAVIAACARASQWKLVLALVAELKDTHGAEGLTAATLEAMLKAPDLSLPRALSAVLEHVSSQTQRPSSLEIAELGQEGGSKEMSVDELLMAVPSLPSAFVQNQLLTLCRRCGDWRSALKILQTPVVPLTEFKSGRQGKGRDAVVIGFTIVLSTMAEAGEWERALELLDTVFMTYNSSSTSASSPVDETIIRSAAQLCAKLYGRSFYDSPQEAIENESGVDAGRETSDDDDEKKREIVLSFLSSLRNPDGRFAVPYQTAAAAIASAVSATLMLDPGGRTRMRGKESRLRRRYGAPGVDYATEINEEGSKASIQVDFTPEAAASSRAIAVAAARRVFLSAAMRLTPHQKRRMTRRQTHDSLHDDEEEAWEEEYQADEGNEYFDSLPQESVFSTGDMAINGAGDIAFFPMNELCLTTLLKACDYRFLLGHSGAGVDGSSHKAAPSATYRTDPHPCDQDLEPPVSLPPLRSSLAALLNHCVDTLWDAKDQRDKAAIAHQQYRNKHQLEEDDMLPSNVARNPIPPHFSSVLTPETFNLAGRVVASVANEGYPKSSNTECLDNMSVKNMTLAKLSLQAFEIALDLAPAPYHGVLETSSDEQMGTLVEAPSWAKLFLRHALAAAAVSHIERATEDNHEFPHRAAVQGVSDIIARVRFGSNAFQTTETRSPSEFGSNHHDVYDHAREEQRGFMSWTGGWDVTATDLNAALELVAFTHLQPGLAFELAQALALDCNLNGKRGNVGGLESVHNMQCVVPDLQTYHLAMQSAADAGKGELGLKVYESIRKPSRDGSNASAPCIRPTAATEAIAVGIADRVAEQQRR